MKKLIKTGFPAILIFALFFAFVATAKAEEVDFSCMSYKVWGKGHVSADYRDFDVVIYNRCPGAVFWSMCIERIDPWSNEIVETHEPTGYVEVDKKARVNLQLRKSPRKSQFRNRYQEFYVNIGYAVEMPVSSDCFASRCETDKRDLRAQVRANEAAWDRAEKSLTARIKSECSESGWDASHEECEATVRETNQAEMDQYPLIDEELREKMAAIDPEQCQLWSGDLVNN
jgi:hypothetical protein